MDTAVAQPSESTNVGGHMHPARFALSALGAGALALVTLTLPVAPSGGSTARAVATPQSLSSAQPVLAVRAGRSSSVYVLWQRNGSCSSCWILTRSTYSLTDLVHVNTPPTIREVAGNPTGSLTLLAFANPTDGMALEQSATGSDLLYVTHDAARSWTPWPLPAGAQLTDLIAAPTGFFATERVCHATPWRCADTSLLHASPRAAAWTATPIPEARSLHGEMLGVGASRRSVWITANTSTPPYAYLATSTNGGTTFTTRPEGLLNSVTSCALDAMSTSSLWAQCLGGHAYLLLHSNDAGRQWRTVTTPAPNMAQGGGFAPVSASMAYLYLGETRRLYVLSHGGATLRPRGPDPLAYLDSLVFVGALDGLAIGQTAPNSPHFRAAVTDDGGRHWTRLGQ